MTGPICLITTMPTLLTIDTSTPVCTVALTSEGEISRRSTAAERQAAQKLLPLIDELLRANKATISDVDAIAVVTGPGSFTGMRIGVGVAQGLSFASGKPVIGVSALALTALATHLVAPKTGDYWLVAEPARDGEYYFGAYRMLTDGDVELLGTEQVALPSRLKVSTVNESWRAAGRGWSDGGFQLPNVQITSHGDTAADPAAALCQLALIRFSKQQYQADGAILPNYIKEQLDYS